MSDVCLSVAYIGKERSRKTKIGTEVAHVTRDSGTTFKVKRSRSTGHFTHSGVNVPGSCSGDCGNVLSVGTYCYVAVCRHGRLGGARRFSTNRGRRGAGHIVAAVHLQLVLIYNTIIFQNFFRLNFQLKLCIH